MSIYTRRFWKAAAERATKSAAWTASSLLVGAGTGLLDTDWIGCASVTGMAAVLSVLGSVASDKATGGGPSLTNAEQVPDA